MRYILGISGGYYHDSSACIVKDGKVLFMVEEERLSKEKHALDKLPSLCIKRCLDFCGITAKDIDVITLSWNPYYPENKTLDISDPNISMMFDKDEWEGASPKVVTIDHHISHASAVYRTSGFNNSLVFCFDGSGDGVSTSIYLAKNGKLNLLESLDETQSLGWFYQRVAPYIGIGKWYHSGKTMALASFGDPKYTFNFIDINENGYNFYYPNDLIDNVSSSNPQSVKRFYKQHKPFMFNEFKKLSNVETLKDKKDWTTGNILYPKPSKGAMDIAATAQKYLEDAIFSVVTKYHSIYPDLPMCFGGGVAMNCKAMGALQYRINTIKNMYVSPFSTDISGSIGSSLEYNFEKNNDKDTNKMQNAYLGDGFSDEEIIKYLSNLKLKFKLLDDPSDEAATLILEDKIVGWFQGRMEVGPRALGNRSIIARPDSEEIKNKINLEIKNREEWRPFSPSVLEQDNAHKFWNSKFDISKYMTMAYKLNDNIDKDLFKGVMHVDETSRPQVVYKTDNPRYANILSNLKNKEMPAVVLNTSLNLRGMPIARTPGDALRVFYGSSIDAMIIGRCLIEK